MWSRCVHEMMMMMVWAVVPTDLLSLRSISWGGWHAFCDDWSSLYVNGNDVGSPGRHSQCLALVGSVCSMSGYAGFLKLLDATTFKSLYANTAGGAPLWTVMSLSLPGFNGYITCLQVVFQNILVPLVLTSSWTLTTDQLPVEECLWYSVFLHASKMSSPSELALDEQSFNAFYLATFKYNSVWYSVLPWDATDFSEVHEIREQLIVVLVGYRPNLVVYARRSERIIIWKKATVWVPHLFPTLGWFSESSNLAGW